MAQPQPEPKKVIQPVTVDLTGAVPIMQAKFVSPVLIRGQRKPAPGGVSGSSITVHTSWNGRAPESINQRMYQHPKTGLLYLFSLESGNVQVLESIVYPSNVTWVEPVSEALKFNLP